MFIFTTVFNVFTTKSPFFTPSPSIPTPPPSIPPTLSTSPQSPLPLNKRPGGAPAHKAPSKARLKQGCFAPALKFEVLFPRGFQGDQATRSHKFQGGDFGGGGLWFIYGNRK